MSRVIILSNNYISLHNFNYLLIFLIPFSLISGSFIPDLICVLLGLYAIKSIFFDGNFKIFKTYFYLFFIFYFICIVSSIFSRDIGFSFQSSLLYFRFFFYSCAIILLFIHNQNKILNIILVSLLSCLLLLFFDFLINYNQNISERPIVSYLFGDEKKAGSYLSRFYPLLICIILFKDIKFKNIVIHIIILLSTFIIILSFERTALLIFSLSNLLFFIFIKELRKILVVNLLLAISLFTIYSFTMSNNVFNKVFLDTKNQIFTNDSIKIFSDHHETHYITALKMFNSNKILGIGPKMFRIKCSHPDYITTYIELKDNQLINRGNGCATHPHNIYLQLLAETGLPGFIYLFILELFIIFKLVKIRITKNKYSNSKYILVIGSTILLFCNLFPLMPHGNFFNNWINIFYYFSLSIFIYFNYFDYKNVKINN